MRASTDPTAAEHLISLVEHRGLPWGDRACRNLKFYGGGTSADVVMAGGIGAQATANHMWMLNTKYISFRPHRDRNFVPIGGERQSVNQDAMVKLIGWAGNLTMRGSQFQAVLIA